MLTLFNGCLNRIGRNRDCGEGDLAAARDGARSTYSSRERDLQGAGCGRCGVCHIDGRAERREVVEVRFQILEIEGEVKNVRVRVGRGFNLRQGRLAPIAKPASDATPRVSILRRFVAMISSRSCSLLICHGFFVLSVAGC